MKAALIKSSDIKAIEKLPVVRNFRKVIEAKDINLMNKELYQFLTLYCGFIRALQHQWIQGNLTLLQRILPRVFIQAF